MKLRSTDHTCVIAIRSFEAMSKCPSTRSITQLIRTNTDSIRVARLSKGVDIVNSMRILDDGKKS